MEKQIDVSVVMLTYYHEKYIKQAIESVLRQITRYTYEIVIADDCSTDKTRKIINEYVKAYPEIIRAILNEQNLGISANKYNACCQCRGRYIIDLAGDDYWIDNSKIEMQVEFMDSHSSYSAVTTKVEARFDNANSAYAVFPDKVICNKAVTLDEYLRCSDRCFPTNGILMKNYYLTESGKKEFEIMPNASPYIDDSTECLLLLRHGPVFVIDKATAVYRVPRSKKGRTNYNSIGTTMDRVKKKIDLYNFLADNLRPELDFFYIYKRTLAIGLADCCRNMYSFKSFFEIYNSVPDSYKQRHLLYRTIPDVIISVYATISSRIKARLYK